MFSCHVSLSSSQLRQFLDIQICLVLRRAGHVFCTMLLGLGLSGVFLMVILGLLLLSF